MEFSSLFAVIIVSEASKLGEEFVDLGMLDKFWMSTPELGRSVFKADSPMGTIAWSEKMMMGAAICRRTERAAENFNFPDLARELLDLYPTAASYWIGKIEAISSTIVSDLFERIPTDWIDLASKEFAIDLLEFNRQQLTSMIVNFKPKE